jgi:hypothetical protein
VIEAVAADPNLSPLDYFLALMRKETLPLPVRVKMAVKALPYLHAKRSVDELDEPAVKPEVGRKSGSTADAKAISDQGAEDVHSLAAARQDTSLPLMPLDFLLAVMRAPDTPTALRFKIACITAPYLHKKRTTGDLAGRSAGKPDRFDFVVDRTTAKQIRDDTRRLARLHRTRPKNLHRKKQKAESLLGHIKSRVGSLIPPCPSLYGPEEYEKDRDRYLKLKKRRSRSPLSGAEDDEEAHLVARMLTYQLRPEAMARKRIAELEMRGRLARDAGAPPLNLQEESCLRGLRTLFPKQLPPPLPDYMAEAVFDGLLAQPLEPTQ